MRTKLQKIAAGWCGLMVLLLAGIQLGSAGPGMPPVLWLIFTGVWIFGAAMLWFVPTFGAIGTALYGVILGVQVLNAHGVTGPNVAISVGSFIGTALALAFLMERRRAKSA